MSCTNNATKKAAVIAEEMRLNEKHDGMDELYRRGCFRHLEDVSYARIMLERGQSVDEVAKDLDSAYEGPNAVVHHRCDRVYPPS
jgi:hypothetical protein